MISDLCSIAENMAANNNEKLREVAKKASEMGWKLEWKTEVEGPDHEPTFTSSCIMFGREIAQEQGRSKQEAKEQAASAAFSTFKEEEPSPFGQYIAQLVLEKMRKLCLQGAHSTAPNRTVIAGIVQEDTLTGTYEVVSLGAGTAHRLSTEIGETPSRELNDCHAEVLARRALHKHFYKQLEIAHAMELTARQNNIIFPQQQVHLHMSSAQQNTTLAPPCALNAPPYSRATQHQQSVGPSGQATTHDIHFQAGPGLATSVNGTMMLGPGMAISSQQSLSQSSVFLAQQPQPQQQASTHVRSQSSLHAKSIFVRADGASRYVLRPGVNFHLYIRCVCALYNMMLCMRCVGVTCGSVCAYACMHVCINCVHICM